LSNEGRVGATVTSTKTPTTAPASSTQPSQPSSSSAPDFGSLPGNLHKGSLSAFAGSQVDIGELIDKFKCSKEYYSLEDCLGEHDRDWKRCQAQVKILRQCNDKHMSVNER
jgi:hypothetical protein